MSDPTVNQVEAPPDKLRIAVEGCGHGTLDEIYTSITRACQEKGWSGVDLVIIGGDFQAVRNAYDLNVTAMPQRYRRMADFHQYYSGQKVAPYLTLFVGGNHEASNHLFELYYGGWVAPNIYYLGAANVLNVGPLRIAGLSGIFKGYDYRKAHFERLPYNQEDMTTIFHARELDVRKLLSLRSQVDVGLSHDWPEGVVWKGAYRSLFSKKRGFEEDAKNRKLGSDAARYCLERLRPRYWFSAHLHIKYTALVNHDDPHKASQSKPAPSQQTASYKAFPRPEHQAQVSAWQNFQGRDEAPTATNPIGADGKLPFTVQETFKQVIPHDNFQRTVHSIEKSEWSPATAPKSIPQLDGCSNSLTRKRLREGTTSPEETRPSVPVQSLSSNQVDGTGSVSRLPDQATIPNPDAIDVDISDDDQDQPEPAPVGPDRGTSTHSQPALTQSEAKASVLPGTAPREPSSPSSGGEQDLCEAGGVSLAAHASDVANEDPSTRSHPVATQGQAKASVDRDENPQTEGDNHQEQQLVAGDVSEDLRAELASLSKSFAEPLKLETSPSLPFPKEITNKLTQFLALDKCEPGREFIQLLEVSSITSEKEVQRPVQLGYDAEWLAILRVFASELELGGSPTDRAPPHRGDTFYNTRIIEEKKWVQERIVDKGLLQVPNNFTITAPVYDPELKVDPSQMPREYSNPQTAALCKLVGIENKFAISESEVDARIAAGPRDGSGQERRRGGRGGGRGRGRGGRGGPGGRGGRGGGGGGGGGGRGYRRG